MAVRKIYTVLSLKDKFSPEIKKCAKSTEALTAKAKINQKEVKNLSNKLKKDLTHGAKVAGAAMLGVATAIGAASYKMVQNTIEATDTVDKMSQKIGISAKAYQEWDYAMGQSGVNINVMKNGMKTMVKQMQASIDGSTTAQRAFERLGVSVEDSNGKMKSQETIMSESIKALTGMKDGSERAALASELFGRAGAELAPLLNGGTQGIQDLIDRSHELGLVMDDETIKAGVLLGDTFDDVKQSLSKAAITVGAELMPYFQKGAELIISKLPEIRKAASFVGTAFKTMANAIKWVCDNSNILIPIMTGVIAGLAAYKIIGIITALMNAWKIASAAAGVAQFTLNGIMAACPLVWIVAAIAAVVAAGVALWKNWDTVCKWASKLKARFLKLIAPIKTVVGWLGKVFGFSDKTVDVNVNKKTTSVSVPKGRRHALGTSYFQGGYTGINEGGRKESAILPSGTQIIPADKTKKAMSQQSSPVINIVIEGNVIGEETYINKLGGIISGRFVSAMGNI